MDCGERVVLQVDRIACAKAQRSYKRSDSFRDSERKLMRTKPRMQEAESTR